VDAYAQAFWLPKAGNSVSEYEDAFFPRRIKRRKGLWFRFAVADGATETSFSGVWARLLVSAFVRHAIGFDFAAEEIRPLQAKWERLVHRKSLPWYAEEKLASGAFSSLLGLEFREEESSGAVKRVWRAAASGDSCMVQMRGDEIVAAFPLQEAASFTSRPDLLSSLPTARNAANGVSLRAEGCWGCDDTFFLMTDALGCWFFREKEAGGQPWATLRDLDTQGQTSFTAFVDSLRGSGAMKNDDVTLIRIDIHG
jgi:hypothetical protein